MELERVKNTLAEIQVWNPNQGSLGLKILFTISRIFIKYKQLRINVDCVDAPEHYQRYWRVIVETVIGKRNMASFINSTTNTGLSRGFVDVKSENSLYYYISSLCREFDRDLKLSLQSLRNNFKKELNNLFESNYKNDHPKFAVPNIIHCFSQLLKLTHNFKSLDDLTLDLPIEDQSFLNEALMQTIEKHASKDFISQYHSAIIAQNFNRQEDGVSYTPIQLQTTTFIKIYETFRATKGKLIKDLPKQNQQQNQQQPNQQQFHHQSFPISSHQKDKSYSREQKSPQTLPPPTCTICQSKFPNRTKAEKHFLSDCTTLNLNEPENSFRSK